MCIAKNLLWTTLKAIFSIFVIIYFVLFIYLFVHLQIQDFQIVVSLPNMSYPTYNTSMESLFIQLSDYV